MVICEPNQSLKQITCSLHHDLIHGFSPVLSTSNIRGHIMVEENLSREPLDCALDERPLAHLHRAQDLMPHAVIRNFSKVANSKLIRGRQVGYIQRLPGGEDVAILKTVWLRIFIRKCLRARQVP